VSGGVYALGPDDEWLPMTGVSEFVPVLAGSLGKEELLAAVEQAHAIEPLTWTTPIRYLSADETRQLAAVRRVRAGAIAWWNEAQR
jgi:hypothetical protein